MNLPLRQGRYVVRKTSGDFQDLSAHWMELGVDDEFLRGLKTIEQTKGRCQVQVGASM